MSPFASATWVLLLGLFAGILACLEFGYRIGRGSSLKNPQSAYEGTGAIEAALFALLGLLLGFSFAGATSRLDSRHQLIVQEANAVGTAYLRLDLLPPGEQPKLRELFRDYLDARVQAYAKLARQPGIPQEFARASQLQQQIWSQALAASRTDPSQESARLLMPAINDMIDVTTSRAVALDTHLPALIFYLLICVALLTGLLAGYDMSRRHSRSWLHILVYAAVISLTVYTIFDFDNPRYGLIRADAADKALLNLRDSMR
jgi:hypothetical protein